MAMYEGLSFILAGPPQTTTRLRETTAKIGSPHNHDVSTVALAGPHAAIIRDSNNHQPAVAITHTTTFTTTADRALHTGADVGGGEGAGVTTIAQHLEHAPMGGELYSRVLRLLRRKVPPVELTQTQHSAESGADQMGPVPIPLTIQRALFMEGLSHLAGYQKDVIQCRVLGQAELLGDGPHVTPIAGEQIVEGKFHVGTYKF